MPDEPGLDQWYQWKPKEDYDAKSYIAMDDWLDAPAGKHGRIGSQDDKLVYNGKPIKLWGINNCYASCAPEKDLADKRAAMYRRYGINAVRLHKYADGTGWAGIQAPESFLKFDKDKLDRMDYYIATLKENGIYTKLSSTFGVKLGPEDSKHVPFMGEFGKLKGGRGRVSTGHGSVYLSRELQDMQIQQVVKLLNHRNPHTGMKYADDPAIAIVELFNEDSALFFGTMGRLQKIPQGILQLAQGPVRHEGEAAGCLGGSGAEQFRQRGPHRRKLGGQVHRAGGQPVVLRSDATGRVAEAQVPPSAGHHALPVRASERVLPAVRQGHPGHRV
jgi:hypothetical protein